MSLQNYHTKAALIILHSRVNLPPVYSRGSETPKVNRWVCTLSKLGQAVHGLTRSCCAIQFNVELEETDILRDQLRIWRTCDATENRPPPLIIETYLDTRGLTSNQSLVILDENGKRWDVLESLAVSHPTRAAETGSDDIILERWRIELGDTSNKFPTDLGSILPTVYKKSIVLFRSLFAYTKFLPAWKFAKRNRKLRANPALQIKYRILNAHETRQGAGPDHLTVPLHENGGKVVDTYNFGTTESPAGPFSVDVTYRTSCDFRVDDSEALLSSRFMGADDEIFRPSLPSGNTEKAEVGSLPVQKQFVGDPDPSRAYGSLSTFHHVGPPTGTSPLSALRMVRDTGTLSPSPGDSSSQKPLSTAKIGSGGGRAAALAGEGGQARRSSMSFQPFKAPPLSASPSLVDPPLASPRSMGLPRPVSSDKSTPPTSAPTTATRKPMPTAPENAIASSNSASPRPAPISRYSSAFSHRRGRSSVGASNKAEDDIPSERASAASSAAQPGSGLLAEPTGTSADSIHADDENISEFLKMLDLRKDFMNPANSANDTPARKTTATSAALTRFQRMRDSNAALSDSMSSSVHMQRSSNSSSKQLSGVPPMAAGTSISTASSPGKPISPHTPHTPAIPSRLSSHSIVAYNEPETNPRGLSDGHESPMEDNDPSGDATQTTAIDIPRSPYLPAYTGDAGSGPAGRISGPDDDDDFPFPMRSVSAGDRPTHSLSAIQQRQQQQQQGQQYENADNHTRRTTQPSPLNEDPALASGPVSGVFRDIGVHRGGSGPTATSSPSNNHIYIPRFGHTRGRGSSGGPRSLSSGSSSLARGGIPHSFPERDQDREGNASGSNSGGSTTEARRGSGQRPSSGRAQAQQTPVEEDEPLLFAMSDFGTSRRSLEEGRHGNHGTDSSGNTGSRRGSSRRGMGPPGFHVWS